MYACAYRMLIKKVCAVLGFLVLGVSVVGCSSEKFPDKIKEQHQPSLDSQNVKSPVPGLFSVFNFRNGLRVFNRSGKQIFSFFPEDVANPSKVGLLSLGIKHSAELIVLENSREKKIVLMNQLGREVYSMPPDGVSAIDVSGPFLIYVHRSGEEERQVVVNSEGKMIFDQVQQDNKQLITGSSCFSFKTIAYGGGSYVNRQAKAVPDLNVTVYGLQGEPLFQGNDNDSAIQLAGAFFSYLENGSQVNQKVLHVKKGVTEVFQGQILASRSLEHSYQLSGTLLSYKQAEGDGSETVHVRNLQTNTEIFKKNVSDVAFVKVQQGFFEVVDLDRAVHVMASNGSEIVSSNSSFLPNQPETKYSMGFMQFVDEQNILHVYNTSGQEILRRSMSEIEKPSRGNDDRAPKVSDHFMSYFEAQAPFQLRVLNLSGQEVFLGRETILEIRH